MRLSSFMVLVSLTPSSLADVVFTSPSRGQTLSTVEPIKVRCEENGLFPQVEMLESYQLFLCTGGNSTDDIVIVNTLFDGKFTGDDELNVAIDPGINPQLDGSLFFLKMVSVIRIGGNVTNYSGRFTLSLGLSDDPGQPLPSTTPTPDMNLDGPPREVKLAVSTVLPKRLIEKAFTMLSIDENPTVYAPMQSYPPTKITKSTPSPQYPPSSCKVATTPLPPNRIVQTTITKPVTWTFSQEQNPNAPLPMQTDLLDNIVHMRWRD